MTELASAPKAQMQWEPPGTWNLEKLHFELKYLGKKLAEAKLVNKEQCIFSKPNGKHGKHQLRGILKYTNVAILKQFEIYLI